MTVEEGKVIIGRSGNIRLRRSSGISWSERIEPDDINTALNRIGFEKSTDNLLVGDRILMETDDSRGLAFIRPEYWSDREVQGGAAPYIHLNAMGGLRLFKDFADAANNNRAAEVRLRRFSGKAIDVRCTVRDTVFNDLGLVERWTFNSDRAAIDITELGSQFREMYDAGLLSGTGTIDCLFATSVASLPDGSITADAELPLMMMQLLQRIDIGAAFDAALHVTDRRLGAGVSVFYGISGIMTKAGIDVSAADATKVALNFVTTGQYRLLVGDPQGYILKEDDFYISTERGLGFILKEESD